MDLIIWTGEWSKNWLSFIVTESSKVRYREREREKKKSSESFMCFNLELVFFWEPIWNGDELGCCINQGSPEIWKQENVYKHMVGG